MCNEVVEFANEVGAIDLKAKLDYSKYHGLFKRRNYFLLSNNIFLIVKISRSKKGSFWGVGKQFLDFFNAITEKNGNYFFVALLSSKSGSILSKNDILNQISNRSLSYSESEAQYKINNYNLKQQNSFSSIEEFLNKISVSK